MFELRCGIVQLVPSKVFKFISPVLFSSFVDRRQFNSVNNVCDFGFMLDLRCGVVQ